MNKQLSWLGPYASFTVIYILCIFLLRLFPSQAAILFCAPLSMSIAGALFVRKTRFPYSKPFSFQRISFQILLYSIVFGIGLILVGQFNVIFGQTAVIVFDSSNMIAFLFILIATPIIEEFFFRGIIFHRTLGYFTPLVAMILSSVLFALLHGMQKFLYAFLAGIVFSCLAYYTKSMLSAIIAHLLANVGPLLLCILFPSLTVVFLPDTGSTNIGMRIVAVLTGLLICVAGIQRLRKLMRPQPDL